MAWLGKWFGVGIKLGNQWRPHVEDCVEEGSQLARVKFYRNGRRGRETLSMEYFSINIADELEMQLAWWENSSYFGNNFPIFLFSDNLNTSVFNVCNILRWIHFLGMNTFPNIFRSTFFWIWTGNVWI